MLYSNAFHHWTKFVEDAPLAKLAGITSRSSLLPVGDISYSAVTGSNLVCPPWS